MNWFQNFTGGLLGSSSCTIGSETVRGSVSKN